jgi:hypothetical protein
MRCILTGGLNEAGIRALRAFRFLHRSGGNIGRDT